jgi:LytS/YehU family sensor histidine kinase
VRRYLAIEQLRFGPRLSISIRMNEDAARLALPPLLLQPLVENAVKHGIATLIDGGEVTIVIERRDGRLVVSVDNPYDPDEQRPGSGIGLANVRGRLDALFGQAASLNASTDGSRFRVDLSLPAEEV